MKMPEKPPKWQDMLERYANRLPKLLVDGEIAGMAMKYYHWDDLKYRPLPDGVSREEAWLAFKTGRSATRRELPLKDGEGMPFSFSLPDELLKRLDELSAWMTSGEGSVFSSNASAERLSASESLIEETISSTLLEGAPTTHADARGMLLKKAEPRNVGEQMVLGAFNGMSEIYSDTSSPFTIERLLEVHRLFTEKSIAAADGAGRFRRDDENVRVADGEGNVFHVPPASGDELRRRVQRILDFANGDGENNDEVYLPSVVRAIVVHFALSYEHPFCDGNGRVARAMMYWTLLHLGCRRAKCVSISGVLNRASAQYAHAFLLTETDDNDLTYFLLHQTGAFLSAIRLQSEERMKAASNIDDSLPSRQRRLMCELKGSAGRSVTIAGYCKFAQVSYATGRSDLIELERKGLLSSLKDGHARVYMLRV